tara:strand:- start:125539 stop:126135 length:597 start_codon:yes stop_codon:yes gene_type:complete
MTAVTIWVAAVLTYTAFWCWYVGFRRRITPAEAEATMDLLDKAGSMTPKQRDSLAHFLANDDGRDFVMVNLLELKKPVRESRKNLDSYQKIFLGGLLRKAGHPVMIATAASGNVENVACEHADDWMAAGMIRYRSRRDLMEVLPTTVGSEHHGLKLAALEKTFAFPASPWFMLGGPRVVVALAVALIAALTQLAIAGQ